MLNSYMADAFDLDRPTPQANPFMADIPIGDDIGRALDRLGAYPSVVAKAEGSPHGWMHGVAKASGESFLCLLEQVEDLIDERGISGEDALRVLTGALS
jgi:hypothetical protein